jgi:hypothetical protein
VVFQKNKRNSVICQKNKLFLKEKATRKIIK